MFGILFCDKQEAAFSCYRMLQAIGLAVAFGYSYILNITIKLYIMGAVLLIGLGLYGVIEYRLKSTEKSSSHVVTL